MIYFVELDEVAETHLEMHIKSGNKILLKKIQKLLKELEEHPERGTGKPKKLKYQNTEVWVRKIDDRHRMRYVIDKNRAIVYVISLWGHYDDKASVFACKKNK